MPERVAHLDAVHARPSSPVSTSERVAHLDGLRCVACTLVICFHLTSVAIDTAGDPVPEAAFPNVPLLFARAGRPVVTFFFVLSGFAAALDLQRQSDGPRLKSAVEFVGRRAARLLPAYYAALAAFVVATKVGDEAPSDTTWLCWVSVLGLFGPWVPVKHCDTTLAVCLYAPGWFVQSFVWVLIMFSVAYNPILASTRAGGWAVTASWLAGFTLLDLVVGVLSFTVLRDSAQLIYVFPPGRLVQFLMGTLSALLLDAAPAAVAEWPGWWAVADASLLALPCAWTYSARAGLVLATPTCVYVAASLADARTARASLTSRALAHASLVALAPASFAAYIFQGAARAVVMHGGAAAAGARVSTRPAGALASLLLSWGVGVLWSEHAERPLAAIALGALRSAAKPPAEAAPLLPKTIPPT